MKFLSSLFLIFCIFLTVVQPILAESSYVLPYPSAMPGSKVYKVNLLWEEISRYWYFGSFGQFKYNLKFSDKYLVEAKTLFEYKQYLLAINALQKSDHFFQNITSSMIKAKDENKNTVQAQKLLKEASLKHVEELKKIKDEVPGEFDWIPEKSTGTKLNLWEKIDASIIIRRIN